jgi:hypothetical protein
MFTNSTEATPNHDTGRADRPGSPIALDVCRFKAQRRTWPMVVPGRVC